MFRAKGVANALAFLSACLLAGLLAVGCGGSDSDTSPPPDERQAKIGDAGQQLKDGAIDDGTQISQYLKTLPGQAGLVVASPGGNGPRLKGGDLTTGSAWSTIKVPIAQRVLADAGGPDKLTPEQASQITAALTLSDNDAAAALFDGLVKTYGSVTEGSEAVGEMLGEAGDTKTIISTEGRDGFSSYGQTEWSLAEQNRYIAALAGGCLADQQTTGYLLEEMSNVTSDTWGLGSAGGPARWKGGWGPGTDGKYLVRQMGVVELSGGEEMAITLAAIPDDGSFESGQAMATAIAKWAVKNLAGDTASPADC